MWTKDNSCQKKKRVEVVINERSQITKQYEVHHNSRFSVRLCVFSGKLEWRAKITKTKYKGYWTLKSHMKESCILCECLRNICSFVSTVGQLEVRSGQPPIRKWMIYDCGFQWFKLTH